jgi:hypothetical protein
MVVDDAIVIVSFVFIGEILKFLKDSSWSTLIGLELTTFWLFSIIIDEIGDFEVPARTESSSSCELERPGLGE